MFQPVLVSGYSLEVNATSDMDFSLSVYQVRLMHSIFLGNISPLIDTVVRVTSMSNPDALSGVRRGDLDPSLSDSGVESEVSTVRSLMQNRGMKMTEGALPCVKEDRSMVTSQPEADVTDWVAMTPFDILLTAGKISFMLYSHEDIDPSSRTGTGGGKDTGLSETRSDLDLNEFFRVPGLASTVDATNTMLPSKEALSLTMPARKDTKFWPFLYAYFSQPHSLVSIHRDSQKVELSCFDIVLKGARPGYVVQEEGKVTPEPSDFAIHWIESRPGKAHPKTGIPPSLYTLAVTDFLLGSGQCTLLQTLGGWLWLIIAHWLMFALYL